MRVKFNEFLEPSYELNKAETQELEQTGFMFNDEEQIGVIKIDDQYIVVKAFDEYESLKLNCDHEEDN